VAVRDNMYLVALDGLLRLAVGLVGVVQGNLQLVDVSLQLLLDPERLCLGALLGLQRGLHRLHGALVVLPAQAYTLRVNPIPNGPRTKMTLLR
jgi:hypothetical protein